MRFSLLTVFFCLGVFVLLLAATPQEVNSKSLSEEQGVKHDQPDGYTSFMPDLTTNTLKVNNMTVKSSSQSEFYPVLVNVNTTLMNIDTTLKTIFRVSTEDMIVNMDNINKFKVQEQSDRVLEAKAYLIFPVMSALNLLLLLLGSRIDSKLLVVISGSLFVLSVIGSCVVFPIILKGIVGTF